MNQLNNEREAMLIPGTIIEDGSREESCTDPTMNRYQVCGIAKDSKGLYVVVYQALFDERETYTIPIQEFLGGVDTMTLLGKVYTTPKFKLCKEVVDVSQNLITSGMKDSSIADLSKKFETLHKEVKHMNRDLKKVQKLTNPLKEVKLVKGLKKDASTPVPMPTIPVSYPAITPQNIPSNPTCTVSAINPTTTGSAIGALEDLKNEALAAISSVSPDMTAQAAKLYDDSSKPTTQKEHKIRMIEEEK